MTSLFIDLRPLYLNTWFVEVEKSKFWYIFGLSKKKLSNTKLHYMKNGYFLENVYIHLSHFIIRPCDKS